MPGSEYLHCFFPLPPLQIINQCAFSPFSRPTTSQTSIVRLAYEAKSNIIISLTLKCIQIYFEGNNFVLHPLHVGLFFDFKHIADAFNFESFCEISHSNAPADLPWTFMHFIFFLDSETLGSKSNLTFTCSKVEVSLKRASKCKACRFNIFIGNRNALTPGFWGAGWITIGDSRSIDYRTQSPRSKWWKLWELLILRRNKNLLPVCPGTPSVYLSLLSHAGKTGVTH